MAASQQLAANFAECGKTGAREIGQFYGALVVIQLTDKELAGTHMRPTEKRVRLQLHGALADYHALAIVLTGIRIGQIG